MIRLLVIALSIVFSLVGHPVHAQAPDVEKMLAVLDLDIQASLDQELRRTLTEAVIAGIVDSDLYDVIDRAHRDRILAEQAFQCSDIADSACRVKMGRLLGVAHIVTGSVTRVGERYIVNLQRIRVQTGRIEGLKEAACACGTFDLRQTTKAVAQQLAGLDVPLPVPTGGGEAPTIWNPPGQSTMIVRFESRPPGAVVLKDGRLLCQQAPCAKALAPGTARIAMEMDRYYRKEAVVKIEKGMLPVALELVPRQGALEVRAIDSDGNAVEADVYVGGAVAGKTYAPITLLIGTHEVEVRSSSGTWKGQVEVTERQVAGVTAKLTGGSGQSVSGSGSTAGMVLIPGGSFMMGCVPGDSECSDDEKPRHRVTVGSFYMDTHEVKVSEYKACVQAGRCKEPATKSSSDQKYTPYYNWGKSGRENYPVNGVSWNDANSYCSWKGGRLPTEAEWEYTARGGLEGKIYPWGDTFKCSQANADDETKLDSNTVPGGAGCDGYEGTSPVGRFPVNGYGLFDMSGNVWEWCSDWYGKDYYSSSPANNPAGPGSGEYRVLRGGSWDFNTWLLRASGRYLNTPAGRLSSNGFRCVRD